jgi:predicted RNA-binding protein with PUA-like domain
MKYFLAKTDPHTYSIDELEKEKTTTWNGVRNAQAVIFLKQMDKGDKVLIYHSQGESSIVGLAEVTGNSRPDPHDSKSWLVDFKFIKKFKAPYITLQEIKATNKFPTFLLVKNSRLSTMIVPEEVVEYLTKKGLAI